MKTFAIQLLYLATASAQQIPTSSPIRNLEAVTNEQGLVTEYYYDEEIENEWIDFIDTNRDGVVEREELSKMLSTMRRLAISELSAKFMMYTKEIEDKFDSNPGELINNLDTHGPKFYRRMMFSKAGIEEWGYR